jgi:peptidyl-prolyl cis-trans isomerase C
MVKNRMKLIIATCILAIGCSTLPAAESTTNKATPAAKPADASSGAASEDDVIVKGKGIEIKRKKFTEAMNTIQGARPGQGMSPEQLEMFRPQVLDRLVAMELLNAKATAEDKAKAKEQTAKRIEEIIKSAGTQEALETQLKTRGITLEEFRSKLTEEAVAQAVMERELKVQVSDADAKKYYEENPSKFERPEMVRASHILLMTQDQNGQPIPEEKKKEKLAEIEGLLKKARAGENFAKLAKDHSEDPGSKDRGGEYTFPRGQMVPEFEKAAFALNTNEVSEVITTQFGYHIIKLHEKMPAKKVSYDEVEDRLKDALKAEALQKEMPAYIAKLKEEANVQVLDESLKPKPMPQMGMHPAGGANAPQPVAPPPSPTGNKKAEKKK